MIKLAKRMPSTQYDLKYLKALGMLRAKGKNVEDPYRTRDGVRYVRVGGMRWRDERVFAEANGTGRPRKPLQQILARVHEWIVSRKGLSLGLHKPVVDQQERNAIPGHGPRVS
jgi:hypothetical protein